jgi:hypothetical protein
MFFNSISKSLQEQMLGIYSASPQLLVERNLIMGLYSYFEGEAKSTEAFTSEVTRGQSWATATDLDYTPSQDIRNHVKKLMLKQRRFMFGKSPSIMFKPLDKKSKNSAEQKRMIIDNILDESNFWRHTFKAFMDCTIGKRVLLTVIANPGQPISYKYYTSLDFTYKTDPNDYTKLTEVIIAYCDESTSNLTQDKQVWNRWKYFMENGICYLTSGTYNGNAQSLGDEETFNTELDEIPCKVIINGGLTGDIEGTSDLQDLIDMQDAYNKITSDYRDALKFKMFEQPVFTDADSEGLAKVKIAPNAMIDLKTDPSIENGKADAKMLSSSFSFVQGANDFLNRTKSDMYEIMDQPRPEDLMNVPSAKALKFMFYDLIARCEEKWQEWEPAIKWMIKFSIKCIDKFNLHQELNAKSFVSTPTNIIIQHNYPIPEDEETQKNIAMAEVGAKVRSHKSYIRDFSDIEDEDGEWSEIIEEEAELTSSMDSLSLSMGAGVVSKKTDNTNKEGVENG